MKIELLEDKAAYKIFTKVSSDVYSGNEFYRGTESSVEKMLLTAGSAFSSHSEIKMFVIRDGDTNVARFALINDSRLSEYVQVSYFEAHKGLGNIFPIIRKTIAKHFPTCSKAVVGLNGHLNYGAGILLNRFNEVPLFGLPYNPDYYADYFSDLKCRSMVTFRFKFDVYTKWGNSYSSPRKIDGLTVRFMNKKNIEQETRIYTELNNRAFINHPYWANRDIEEDLELFKPFRFLLDNENLIIAEVHGEPVGFFLWYPDFNKMISSHRDFNVLDVVKFRMGKFIDTLRFTEIGIVPKYQGSPVALSLISKALPVLVERGYRFCEGGFIFEENRASIAFVKRILQRCFGSEPEVYRRFATFETRL